jgi:uncharacterized membrane protein
MVSIEVKGIDEAKDFIKKEEQIVTNNVAEAIKEAVFHLQNKIKTSIAHGTNAPVTVDTGRFLNSVDVGMDNYNGKVFTEVEYAKFLEYGTSKFSARPHFRNTASVEENAIKDKFKKLV